MKNVVHMVWLLAVVLSTGFADAQSTTHGAGRAAPRSTQRPHEVRRTLPTLTEEQTAEAIRAEDADLKQMMQEFESATNRLKESIRSSGEVSRSTDSLGPVERPQAAD